MHIKKPLIAGLGGVGSLLAVLLTELGMKVTALDRAKPANMPKGVAFVAGDVGERSRFCENPEKS